MAGGKETPRQKMIGMMYLVLTALLALNVSKQVIAAFITINDKLDRSINIIDGSNDANYGAFDKKRTTIIAQKGDVKIVEKWQNKATEVDKLTRKAVSFLLSESNEMIKVAEGVDWIAHEGGKDEEGNIVKLEPLSGVLNMDNYDIPTNFFIGSDPKKPLPRGLEIPKKVVEYRNAVAEIMGTYKEGKKNYTFKAPADLKDLPSALATCNPVDTAQLKRFMKSLDIQENISQTVHGVTEVMPWPSVMFDHAPIVAAAAMLTALKLDVKNAESIATKYLLGKVDVQEFNFNKIEPLAFASTGYINQGDSLSLKVMVAAYDSTDMGRIKWGQDADTSDVLKWSEKDGKDEDRYIRIRGDQPGEHKIKGVIYVKQRGEEVQKNWDFSYTVGQPMGIVALPEMRVLYRGYKNMVEGTASGFAADKVSLSGSGCSLSKSGKQWVATVGSGVREATINVNGRKDDGGSVNLGSFKFKVKKLPAPTVYLGGITNGQTPGLSAVKANGNGKVSCRYDESIPLTGVTFNLVSGTVTVDGIKAKGKIGGGGKLDGNAKKVLAQSRGKQVTILVNYRGPDGVSQRGALVFTPR